MDASPKISTNKVDSNPTLVSKDLAKRRQEVHNNKLEPYTHFVDRMASKEGYRQGMYWTSGDHYVGDWHLNLRHGRGIHTYCNGSIYEGEWKHGKRDGHGTFWVKDETSSYLIRKYCGEWRSNLPWGNGLYYGLGGELYSGQCQQGKRHGIGKQTYRDWKSKDEDKFHTYYGSWVNGKREGLGQLTMSNGNMYQGSWKNDWKEGKGVYLFKDGKANYQGWWRDDLAVSGVYAHNKVDGEGLVPVNLWLPSVRELSDKWMKLGASRLPLAKFDIMECQTDPAVATRKFSQKNIVYGSLLHGPLNNPNIL